MTTARSTLRARLDEQGYIVVPGLVPRENLDAVISDIWRHTGASPHDRASWYQPALVSRNGMVEMYHYQSMWNNRQYPPLHRAFAEVLGTERLWVSLDRANLKPPADPRHPQYDHAGFIHWDAPMERYPDIAVGVQGVLALTDTDESMGGFQCVPELYRDLDAWISRQPAGPDPRKPDLTGYSITQVPLRAGDLVIWSTLLPHGNGHNTSPRPRLAQYISMLPARDDDAVAREARITCWQTNSPPASPSFPGDPRRIEEQRSAPAELTPLGRKLLGLDLW